MVRFLAAAAARASVYTEQLSDLFSGNGQQLGGGYVIERLKHCMFYTCPVYYD